MLNLNLRARTYCTIQSKFRMFSVNKIYCKCIKEITLCIEQFKTVTCFINILVGTLYLIALQGLDLEHVAPKYSRKQMQIMPAKAPRISHNLLTKGKQFLRFALLALFHCLTKVKKTVRFSYELSGIFAKI